MFPIELRHFLSECSFYMTWSTLNIYIQHIHIRLLVQKLTKRNFSREIKWDCDRTEK